MNPDLFSNMAEVEQHHWWFRARRAIVLEVLATLDLPEPRPPKPGGRFTTSRDTLRASPDDARILDLGAGTGGTTSALTRFGRVTALEIDPAARQHLDASVLEGVWTDPLPDPSRAPGLFDVVTAFDVLEHLPDDQAVLTDVHRLLKPGGHLLATVPAHPALWTVHDDHHHHVRRYTWSGLRRVLADSGFSPVLHSWWLSTLFLPFLAERLKARIRPPHDVHVRLPPRPINALLARLVGAERHLVARGIPLPVGASMVVLARRSR